MLKLFYGQKHELDSNDVANMNIRALASEIVAKIVHISFFDLDIVLSKTQ